MNQIELVLLLKINELLCFNSDIVLNFFGLILTLVGVILSCISICQVIKARKDIALNQVKNKQAEVMGNLLKHLNQQVIRVLAITVGADTKCPPQKEFFCNIFEFEELLNEYTSKGDFPIFLSEDSFSIINVDEYQFDGSIDINVANSLSLFAPNRKLIPFDINNYQGQTIIIIQSKRNPNDFSYSGNKNVNVLNNNNVNYSVAMKRSIMELRTAISNWYESNKIPDCNIFINPQNLKSTI